MSMYVCVRGCTRMCRCARECVQYIFMFICMCWLHATAFRILFGEIRTSSPGRRAATRQSRTSAHDGRAASSPDPCQVVIGDRHRGLLQHLGYPPCSPTAKSGTTATVTATTRFPNVSVSSSFSLLLSDCSYYCICYVIVQQNTQITCLCMWIFKYGSGLPLPFMLHDECIETGDAYL